ncbi:uncharacterized protein [Apostichopus japonicus]|uniref:uncharacterized protein n=1 Tax=Stichopus japonicus TaxID=307972 RepID=UPI003AB15896
MPDLLATAANRSAWRTMPAATVMSPRRLHIHGTEFWGCLLPQPIPTESILSILKSRNVKVSWWSDHDWSDRLELNLKSGRWMLQRLFTRQEITDTEYNDTVRNFRTRFGDTEWQKARLATETK